MGMPAQRPSRARIAPASEPGIPMIVIGRALYPGGKPRPDVVVYAHQTNRTGIYLSSPALGNAASRRHGRLRGWARSDA